MIDEGAPKLRAQSAPRVVIVSPGFDPDSGSAEKLRFLSNAEPNDLRRSAASLSSRSRSRVMLRSYDEFKGMLG